MPSRARRRVSAVSRSRDTAVLWTLPEASVSHHSIRRWTRIWAGSPSPEGASSGSERFGWSAMAGSIVYVRSRGRRMRVGVGLPSTVPGANGALLLEWAGRADAGPFSSVGVLDRPAYPSHDPFVSLAAAAATTRRVRLVTMVAIGPLRSTAVLAKQAASVNAVSNGRLVLGLSIGARREDYDVTGVDHRGRGLRLSDQLMELRALWEEGRWVPGPSGSSDTPEGPPL